MIDVRRFRAFLIVFLLAGTVQAQSSRPLAPTEEEDFPVFFTIRENQEARRGFSTGPELVVVLAKIAAQTLSVLDWEHHPQRFPAPPERYNRDRHFGSWIDDPREPDCFNTRAKVLIRESRSPIRVSSSNHCLVDSGDWLEPYANRRLGRASDIQIDHVVALKNAYVSGAYRWGPEFRCLYGNYLGNPIHLRAVEGSENQRKSDRTPADWMPTNRAHHCEFLGNWLKIKMIWGLVLNPREAQAIRNLAQKANCDPRYFEMTAQTLVEQRQIISANQNLCRP